MTGTRKMRHALSEMGLLPSSCKPVVMGILNCTPDSFVVGSRQQNEDAIARRSDSIISEGGLIIDVGACSTRPGSESVSEQEELLRLRRALGVIRQRYPQTIVSVDTFRPVVARMAVEEYGVNIINDVSGGGEGQEMLREAARLGVPYVLTSNDAGLPSMLKSFGKKVELLRDMGMEEVILDPGYGFGKGVIDGNYSVLRGQRRLREAFPDLPILAGISRKRMIWQLLGCSPDDECALHGTMMANLVALQNGANILRTHDVKEAVETIKIYEKTR